MITLSTSSLNSFKSCPRKYQFEYVERYKPVIESEPLIFGRLFHKALELWYGSNKNSAIPIFFLNKTFHNCNEEGLLTKAKLSALISAYMTRYKVEEFETVGVELAFKCPLINPETSRESKVHDLSGVIDRLVKDKKERFWIVETKTTSNDITDGSDYWMKLHLDGQVSQYYIGAEVLGYKVEGCIYDVIKKPMLRPKTDKKSGAVESTWEFEKRLDEDIGLHPDFYFARKSIPRSETDLFDYMFDAYHTIQTIKAHTDKNKFPRYAHSCFSLYGKCKFFSVCSGQASIKDEALFLRKEANEK